jgi:hypothetical protein
MAVPFVSCLTMSLHRRRAIPSFSVLLDPRTCRSVSLANERLDLLGSIDRMIS